MEQSDILAWTLVSECPIPSEVAEILVTGEVALERELESGESWPLARARLEQRLGTAD